MVELKAEFDAWIDAHAQQAVRLDGESLAEFIAESERWCERLSNADVSPDLRVHARERMTKYRELCQFLHMSLHRALSAHAAGEERYGPSAGFHTARVGRYG